MTDISIQKSLNQNKPISEQVHEASVPILDLTHPDFGSQLVGTFRHIGFAIVTNHGINPHDIDRAFETSLSFFRLPCEVKQSLHFSTERSMGYLGPLGEVLDESNRANEKKETLNLGHPDMPGNLAFYPEDPHFRDFFRDFFEQMFAVHNRILAAMEEGLGLEPAYLCDKCGKDPSTDILRLLFYPELRMEELAKNGVTRTGAHSDYGTITLLLQKPGFGQNGLRALSSSKHWVKVEPPDYAMVLNLGDLFQHWSNDTLTSTTHKVEVDQLMLQKLEQKEILAIPERQSIVMFCEPHLGQVLSCLPHCGIPKYEPIESHSYVIGRVKSVNQYKL